MTVLLFMQYYFGRQPLRLFFGGIHVDQYLHGGFPIVVDVFVSSLVVPERKMLAHQRFELNFTGADQGNRLHVVLMTVHHGSVQIQFMVIEHCQIAGSHFAKHRHQNDRASLPGAADGIIDGDVYVSWSIKLDAASNTD